MMRFGFILAAWCGLAAGLRAGAIPAIFVAIGDQHSAYERTAQVVARIDRVIAENPGVPVAVLIDGDTFEGGNVVAQRSGGAIEFALFAALARRAPTVLNLGNHEPEFYDLATTVERIEATGVTVIGNLARRDSGTLFAPDSTRLQLGENEIVIAGLAIDVLAQYRAAVRPSLDVSNPVTWAQRHLPEIFGVSRERGPLARNVERAAEGGRAPVVPILLSHAGLRNDREIFPLVPEGTLFIGAHDHTRFVHRMGRTVYVQSGAWNSHLSIVRLRRTVEGAQWHVEQVAIEPGDPADPELARLIRETEAAQLRPEDVAVVGRLPAALSRAESAKFVARAVRDAAGADAAFIGNTTFGAGLPAGDVTRRALDACVRFDGYVCVAEVSAAQLAQWLAAANQGPDTPFEERRGEFLFGVGPSGGVTERRYRIATTDWGMRNRERYFGSAEIVFEEHPELRLKTVVAEALNK